MILSSIDGSELEINVAGCRRPHPHLRGEWSNIDWLKVRIRVLAPFGSADYQVSCLLNWEAEELAEWLMNIAQQKKGDSTLAFYEGELRFILKETLERYVILRVCFLDATYGWILIPDIDEYAFDDDFPFVDLEMSFNQLAAAVTTFQQELQQLPLIGEFKRKDNKRKR